MNKKSAALLSKAEAYTKELSDHIVLRSYWDKLSLVLKGSTARGNADRYSDIDFVFFTDSDTIGKIISGYRHHGMIQRSDGIFVPLRDWEGHYNFESFDKLAGYFSKPDYPEIWEYQNVHIMHDPAGMYASLISSLSKDLLAQPLDAIKAKYLSINLNLDWLRHPLMRGDNVGVILHTVKVIQELCQICYLMDGKCYPHDKWLFPYIGTTRFGRSNKSQIEDYAACIADRNEKHLELESYKQFSDGYALLIKIAAFINRHYGPQPWLDEWYLFV
ncbi:nucleotidyltransferase domain-containing protein [bacterium]|nr:nucleotidyltransferase domain-containing protein [bacterium]